MNAFLSSFDWFPWLCAGVIIGSFMGYLKMVNAFFAVAIAAGGIFLVSNAHDGESFLLVMLGAGMALMGFAALMKLFPDRG